jgi:4-diphosphocytidyl-2-C-methyl-D-erythritol kinase
VPEALRGRAPAKVNLVLEVLGKRPDGYHEIETVLQTLFVHDAVTLTPADDWRVSASGDYTAGTPLDESNLVIKAARSLARVTGLEARYAIHLEKRIPPAGGLGGGASDAATVLRLIQQAFPAVTEEQILQAAHEVGSDEAFFLVGGTARVHGRGEAVEALPALREHDVVLFVPRQSIENKTARMFAALAKHPWDSGSVARRFMETPPQVVTSSDVFNAFERVAFDLFPWLAALWEDLERRIAEPVRLAGAGPTLFWIGPEGGRRVFDAAQGADCDVILTRTEGPWRRTP